MNDVITAVAFFAVLGGLLGLVLSLAYKKLSASGDSKISDIADLLPGANCGGCGYAGCAAFAEAVAKGRVPASRCNGIKKSQLQIICEITGESDTLVSQKMRAVVLCSGTNASSVRKYKYKGIADCSAAARLHGGSKLCPDGCIGLGSCVPACGFGALGVKDGVAVVDEAKCVGCGACVTACPKGLIELIPANARYYVACKSAEKGACVKLFCEVGCIGCGICVRGCEAGAVKKDGFRAVIEQDKCIGCGVCASKCPRGIIEKSSTL